MRPGGLERRGVGYEPCRAVNPTIVFCTISGYGSTGPYKDLPSHGIAYDVWAGLVAPEVTEDGFCDMPEHPSVGMHAGPLFGALGVLAGITRARATGRPCRIDVAQSDAAAAMDWLRSETWRRSEEHTSELQSLMGTSYSVFCLKKKTPTTNQPLNKNIHLKQTTKKNAIQRTVQPSHKKTNNSIEHIQLSSIYETSTSRDRQYQYTMSNTITIHHTHPKHT